LNQYSLSIEEVKQVDASQYNAVAIYKQIRADFETPLSIYLKLQGGDYSYLLESAEFGRQGRYSLIGADPYEIYVEDSDSHTDPLKFVEKKLQEIKAPASQELPSFCGGAVGYLSFEYISNVESRIKSDLPETLDVPKSLFMFSDSVVVYDHLLHSIKIVSHVRLNGDVEKNYDYAINKIEEIIIKITQPLDGLPYEPISGKTNSDVVSNWLPEDYKNAVNVIKQYIEKGDIIQAVLSQRFSVETGAHPFEIYRSLRAINPSPYMYFMKFKDTHIVGASPELLVKIENNIIENHPIAGTRPRGKDAKEDSILSNELKNDSKEIAEHVMLLDLGRNDIGKVANSGTVEVTQQFDVEYFSHVMHLVSHVRGELNQEHTPYDALRSSFPAGTVSGAPKIRAIEIIQELEPDKRGPYAGAVGFFSTTGDIETCITIRTMVIQDGTAYIQAGGGIVFDSDPQKEFEETQHKAQALIASIRDAEAYNHLDKIGQLGY
tara:strand:- start:13822 stop:15294 length:1473 start_codon:yes stop_codon:yes gene_type:complete